MVSINYRAVIYFATMIWFFSFAPALPAQSEMPRHALIDRIAKSGDGQVIAASYGDHKIRSVVDFFDAETGIFLDTADLAPYTPFLIDLSPTGDRLLWTDSGANIGVYNRNISENQIIIPGGPVYLEAIAWHPTADTIGWSLGSGLTLWDVSTGTNLGVIASDKYTIVSFDWSPDGQKIVTSHSAGHHSEFGKSSITIQVWDVSTPISILTTPLLTIAERGGGTIEWSPDGTRLAVLEADGIAIYDLATVNLNHIPFDVVSLSLAWSPDSTRLATGGAAIRIWDADTLELIHEIPMITGSSLQWSSDGQHLFSGNGLNGLDFIDVGVMDNTITPEADALANP